MWYSGLLGVLYAVYVILGITDVFGSLGWFGVFQDWLVYGGLCILGCFGAFQGYTGSLGWFGVVYVGLLCFTVWF